MKGPSKRHGEGAGYKGIDENWGPVEVNCPLSILDNARAPESENAYEWRKRVRAYHAAKKAKKKALVEGTLIEYGGSTYRLDCKSTTKRGAWHVDMMREGRPGGSYRISARQLADAKVVADTA